MGVTSRLVVTPLTERCWITITGALQVHLGASPAGPAGTGKTESSKDLAKALGMFCIVFNCSEQITANIMTKLFTGLALQGAWSCLDEFNRIDIEVLSVIAQQLLTLRIALLKNQLEMEFEGKKIEIKKTLGVIVTMNPGYAGRTELPDNLKVLFRPVSMMIPDYSLIAEIMLFSEGFESAKKLAKKMAKLYKMSSEQLSQQDHYDFGMRALKSLLVMAGSLKRDNIDSSEEEVLIMAMRDSNIPKFVKEDLPLFEALVQDLFQNSGKIVEKTEKKQSLFDEMIKESIIGLNLSESNGDFKKKVSQLFETFMVRFGVMLVGPTLSGKTECYQTLKMAMELTHKGNPKDERFQNINTYILNPKSISMGELYGDVDKFTMEWSDGLASSIIRSANNSRNKQELHWIVFDGPVDALWIENMNTVLDDNMTLCLANGERIKLRPKLRMLFEVQDLAVASPATVSRCGMVYISHDNVNYMAFIDIWMKRYLFKKTNIHRDFKGSIYNWFKNLYQTFNSVRKIGNEPIPTVDMQVAKNITVILEFLFNKEKFNLIEKNDNSKINLLYLLAFSLIWGFVASFEVDIKVIKNTVKYFDLC